MVIMKFVFVTGLRDIDKKTIVDLALQRANRKNSFKVVDLDSMSEIMDEILDAPDLETARRLLSEFYSDAEKSLISNLRQQKYDVVVIGQLTLGTTYGYIRAMPDGFFRSFKPDNIVILESESNSNLKSNEHENINRYYGTVSSSVSGSVLKIIRFREKKMMEAVKELSHILKS